MWSTSLYALAWLVPLATAQFRTDLHTKTSVAQTKDGTVFTNNITDSGVSVFKGIPYAKPPVGNLRWRSPLPAAPWLQPLNATDHTLACWEFYPQNSTGTTKSEDCLYLHVWTPAKTASDRLAVMVWIHGGGFELDSGLNPLYEGVHLAERDVVVVTLNYRLGNFGFLAHPELDADDPVGNSGNFGIQDAMMALRWVKANIQAFGGDPNNVMVFGESAGAHALGPIMATPMSEGLYDKVMISSGAWWDSEHGNMENFNQSRQRGLDWGHSVVGPSATLAQLRRVPAWLVQNSSLWFGADPGITAFAANIDNFVIPQFVPGVFAKGKVPFLAGFTGREDSIFTQRALDHSSAEAFDDRLFLYLNESGQSEATIRAGMALNYPGTSDLQANASSTLLLGDLVIREQTWEAVHLHEATTGQPSWLYMWNFTSPFNPIPGHGMDQSYEFGTLKATPSNPVGVLPGPADVNMSNYMMTYYTNFAKTSNPNTPDNMNGTLPLWPAYKARKGNSTSDVGTCGPEQGCIFQLANNVAVQDFNYSRFQFIQSFRTNGAFPGSWHDFVTN